VQNKIKHTSIVTTGSPDVPGLPCANGFNGFLRALPGEPGFVATIACKDHRLAGLISASGYQDHTTSPSAFGVFAFRAKNVHRILVPTFVTMAKRPSCGTRTREEVPVICPTSQVKLPATHWHDGQISCDTRNPIK
jgi:hypothetical protein